MSGEHITIVVPVAAVMESDNSSFTVRRKSPKTRSAEALCIRSTKRSKLFIIVKWSYSVSVLQSKRYMANIQEERGEW